MREGRRENSRASRNFSDPEKLGDRIPDPMAELTFLASKLDWAQVDSTHLAYYRDLLRTRREIVQPLLPSIRRGGKAMVVSEQAVRVSWEVGERRLVLDANLSAGSVKFPESDALPFWLCGDAGASFAPWTVRWGIGSLMSAPTRNLPPAVACRVSL